MKCDLCSQDAAVFFVDRSKIDLPQGARLRPGMIINCDDPTSFKGYCNDHYTGMAEYRKWDTVSKRTCNNAL